MTFIFFIFTYVNYLDQEHNLKKVFCSTVKGSSARDSEVFGYACSERLDDVEAVAGK